METFVLYMLLYPEVQRKAREEVENVFGRGYFPSWDEAYKLPYVCAVLKEVLRISPVAVLGSLHLLWPCQSQFDVRLGIPHRALREDVFMNYRIPKDVTVIANIG